MTGIIGANGNVVGMAPNVTFGASLTESHRTMLQPARKMFVDKILVSKTSCRRVARAGAYRVLDCSGSGSDAGIIKGADQVRQGVIWCLRAKPSRLA